MTSSSDSLMRLRSASEGSKAERLNNLSSEMTDRLTGPDQVMPAAGQNKQQPNMVVSF